jgi:hypothetical protein
MPPIAIATLVAAVCVALAGVAWTGCTIRKFGLKLSFVLAFITSGLLSAITGFFAASYLW